MYKNFALATLHVPFFQYTCTMGVYLPECFHYDGNAQHNEQNKDAWTL